MIVSVGCVVHLIELEETKKIMSLLEYSCYNSISNWLVTHLYYTILISITLMLGIIIWFPVMYESPWPYRSHEQFNAGSTDARNRRFVLFILFELKLIFIYILSALVFRLIFNVGPINKMALNYSIIESVYVPIPIEIIVYLMLRYPPYRLANYVSMSFHAQLSCIFKSFLFLLMRYVEYSPFSRLADKRMSFFYQICHFATHPNVSNFQPEKFPLYYF